MTEAIAAQYEDVLAHLFEAYEGPVFAIRLWDGWRWACSERGNPKCTLFFRSKDAVLSLIAHRTEIALGEAFITKDVEVEGDLCAAVNVAEYVFHHPDSQRRRMLEVMEGLLCGISRRWSKGRAHAPERDHAAISYHYDQPIEFYRPWLGETLVYSCAYFASETDSLDAAQTNKLELICRKLRLRPLERLLDIGCGWGSLVIHAAANHDVFAQGITLSQRQADISVARIEAARLTQSASVALLDYRTAPEHFARFDKIASVGMFEHVGRSNLPRYFRTVYDLLKPGGVFLNHGIARAWSGREDDSFPLGSALLPFARDTHGLKKTGNISFIDKYVFPDGELVPLSEAVRAAESAGFEVRDVENLREHYEITLGCWIDALQRNAGEVLRHIPEKIYRIWLLYMAGSAAAFQRGDISLYQMLLSRPDRGRSGLPLTRADWYRSEESLKPPSA